MLMRRKLVMSAGVAVAVVSLAGCQQKLVEGFTVSANGSVTISETSIASYDDAAGPLSVVKPDPAALLTAAKKGTHAFAGPGVGKPVVTLVRLSKHVLELRVSQTMSSLALLNKHGDAFNPASLTLDVSPAKGVVPTPTDPLGLTGPRTEKVTVQAGDSSGTSSASPSGDTFNVTHVGHNWSFLVTENAKAFAQERKEVASLTATLQKAGLSPTALVVQIHVKLPGKVVSTNGKRLAGGVVSWDLFHLTSPKLSLKTTD